MAALRILFGQNLCPPSLTVLGQSINAHHLLLFTDIILRHCPLRPLYLPLCRYLMRPTYVHIYMAQILLCETKSHASSMWFTGAPGLAERSAQSVVNFHA